MEIKSGNPNVNKTQTDPGMGEDAERRNSKWYSSPLKKNKERETKNEPAAIDKQAQCALA